MSAVKRVYCPSNPFITRTATSTQTALPEVGKERTLVRISKSFQFEAQTAMQTRREEKTGLGDRNTDELTQSQMELLTKFIAN